MIRFLLSTIAVLIVVVSNPSFTHAQSSDTLPSARERQTIAQLRRSANRAQYRLDLQKEILSSVAVSSRHATVVSQTRSARIAQRKATAGATTVPPRSATRAPSLPSPERLQENVRQLVNTARASAGLSALTMHPLLHTSAQKYAEWMAQDRFFSHTDPDGRSSADRIRDTSYLQPPCDCAYRYVTGENLAKNQRTAAEVMRAWMNSPTHKENILHPQFEEMGLGYKDCYWVQHFGGMEMR
jgi:uncharacterized protein YkwD